MKLTAVLFSSALVSAAFAGKFDPRAASKACFPGNNCQRAVGGTAGVNPPLASRLADCSRNNVVTIIPPTVTVPAPSSSTSGPTLAPRGPWIINFPTAKKKRTVITITASASTTTTIFPTAVPGYASACTTGGSVAAYQSACSCAGITQATTTLPTPTVTGEPETTCAVGGMIKRGLNMVGYEVAEGFDHVHYDGIELARF